MKMTDSTGIIIRKARPEDAERLLEIYSYYVDRTAVSFEYDSPSTEEFRKRIENTLAHYPYIVIESDGRLQGYAYAGPFKSRDAYEWSCEVSIYIDRYARGRGLGKLLYAALEDRLRCMGILNMYACIAYTEKEDEYLNNDSEKFHSKMGFRKCGEFHECGFKFGRWYDMIWMEKTIGEHTCDVKKPVLP